MRSCSKSKHKKGYFKKKTEKIHAEDKLNNSCISTIATNNNSYINKNFIYHFIEKQQHPNKLKLLFFFMNNNDIRKGTVEP